MKRWFAGAAAVLVVALIAVATATYVNHLQHCQQLSDQIAAGLRSSVNDGNRQQVVLELRGQYARACP